MSISSEDMRQLWQRQALDAPRINLTYLRHQVQRLRRRTQIRNGFEYVSVLFGVAWLIWAGWDFIRPRPLMSFGVTLWVLGTLYVVIQWHRRAAMPSSAEQLGTLDAMQFYRRELVRQRDVRRENWRWSLLPIAPGLVVLLCAMIMEVKPTPWIAICTLVVCLLFAIALSIVGCESAARSIQTEIDALDSMTKTNT